MKRNRCKKVIGLWVLLVSSVLNGTSFAYYEDHTENFDYSSLTPGHELGCLAMNIYHEGRGESAEGQAAIAAVTLNRVRNEEFPNSVCGVVWEIKQFSWTHIAERHHVINDFAAWGEALVIAKLFLDGAKFSKIEDATHYHAESVRPSWIADNKLVGKFGGHYFYIL